MYTIFHIDLYDIALATRNVYEFSTTMVFKAAGVRILQHSLTASEALIG